MPSSSFFSGTNPTPTEYENAVDLVAQATAQATAALASQTAAATSAQSAQGYSVSAGTSADTATTQAASAASSATSASNSATNASSSASSASSSATSASTSASNAATSATNASNSATSAAGSASSASTYATNAASSATAAANSASDAAATLANALVKTNNLADLSNAGTARTNLGVAIGSNVQAWDADLDAIAAISSTSGLLKKTAANTWSLDTTSYLSGTVGLANGGTGATDATGARTALGLGTAATAAATSFAQVANNLSDLVSASTARSNLGLGSVATLASTAVLQSANNLSDLGNVTTARTNLGLSALSTTTPGTGVATALGVNTGTAGAFVVNGGALGTPASGTLTNCTFPTLNQNTTGTAAGLSATLGVSSGGTGLTSLTAGYIPYGNGTGAFSSSANLVYGGGTFAISGSAQRLLSVYATVDRADIAFVSGSTKALRIGATSTSATIEAVDYTGSASYEPISLGGSQVLFTTSATERMRIAANGSVGIGTSSPGAKLDVAGSLRAYGLTVNNTALVAGANQLTLDYLASSTASRIVAWGANTSTPGALLFARASSDASVYNTTMTLDASGNLGLGVTPSAWSSGGWIELNSTGVSSKGTLYSAGNTYYNGGWKYSTTAAASLYVQTAGANIWYNAPSGTAGSAISFTQAMTLDASGRLGVGITSPTATLHVKGGNTNNLKIDNDGSQYTELDFLNNGVAKAYIYWDHTNSNWHFRSLGTLQLYGSGGAGISIDTSNNVLIGTSTSNAGRIFVYDGSASTPVARFQNSSATFADSLVFAAAARNTTNSSFNAYSYYNTAAPGYKFYVADSGKIYSTDTAIGSISDARHKENIRDIEQGLAAILALRPRRFDWKANKGTGKKDVAGFIAQEVEPIFPDLIDPWKDEETSDLKALSMGGMVPAMVKAIQELAAKVSALEARQ